MRAPASLKDALVRETARRGASLNDVAVGMLADAFAVPYTPTGRRSGLPGSSPVVLLRMPETLKREIQAEAFRSSTNTNDVIVRTLADGLGIPHDSRSRRSVPFGGGRGKDHRMAESNGSQNGSDALEGQGARRDHRRRQLRELAPAGRRVLQGREARLDRSRADARRPRRLPHLGHRVHGRLRRRQGQGRRGPVGGDLGPPERHDQVRRRPQDRRHRVARHDARRHREVPLAGRREGARARRPTSSRSCARPARTSSSTTSRSAPRPRRSGTRRRSSRPAARW